MNILFKTIHEKVRIIIAIENIKRNIAVKYIESIFVFAFALFILGITTTISAGVYPKLYIMGYSISVLGFCLTGYLVFSAYSIRNKLNLILSEI